MPDKFVKWPSITQAHNLRRIEEFTTTFPALVSEMYIITEKLHGSNLQLYFEPDLPMRVGSRRRFLDTNQKFYDVWGTLALPRYQKLTNALQAHSDRTGQTLRVFGEYFGKGVQREIHYRDDGHHNIRIFGHMANDILQPAYETGVLILSHCNLSLTYMVPLLGFAPNLQSALETNVAVPSHLRAPDAPADEVMEGIVIRPWHKVYQIPGGPTFMIKKKNPAFLEVKPRKAKKHRVIDEDVAALNDLFQTYITEARMHNIFSQVGPIERMDQLGEYIKLVLLDAKEPFIYAHTTTYEALDAAQKRSVLNVGSLIANMLKDYLGGK